MLGGLWTTFVGVQIWGGALVSPWVLAAALALVAGGLATMVFGAWRGAPPPPLQVALLALLAAGTAARAWVAIVHSPSYGTDELAFDQYAAQLFLHGQNPYAHSMAPALSMFQVPDIFRTWTLSGGVVTRLSYPAGSFLPYLPALALGMGMQAAVVVDLLAWAATVAVLWLLLPKPARFSAVLLGGAGVLFGNAVGGVTDVLYLPLALLALWQWDRFPTSAGWRRWLGPLALGLACTVKQTPWFLVPLLVLGVVLEASSADRSPWRQGGAYLAAVLGPFLALDLPFLAATPGRFLQSMLTPVLAPTVPGGQGLVSLAMFVSGGGYLERYSLAALAVAAAVASGFAWRYPRSKPALPALAALVFFFPSRSFDAYFLEAAPLVLVASTTVPAALRDPGSPLRWLRPPAHSEALADRPRRARRALGVLTATLALLASSTAAWAVASRPPLSLRVISEHSTGQLATVDRLSVAVSNLSASWQRPQWSVNQTGQQSAFWRVIRGPVALAPRSRSVVVLAAPNTASMPSLYSNFVLNAYLAHPASVATSRVVQIQRWSTVLRPFGIPGPLRLGQPLRVTVQVTGPTGDPVRQAGILVDLGQVVYGQSDLLPAEASIDGHPEGHSPVGARTDRRGQASFVVRGVQAQADPVFFQAWVVPRNGVPVSFSNMLSVQFEAPAG